MFTGIVTGQGTIIDISGNADKHFTIQTELPLDAMQVGDSMACSGVCLSLTTKQDTQFQVTASQETLSCTTISDWQVGTIINLEPALCIGDALGGHIVQGHIDGVALLQSMEAVGNSHKLTLQAPDNLKQFIAAKGSVTLDGVSLTVNEVKDAVFTINIIPHTWEHTNFSRLVEGDRLNLEIDVLARYIERYITCNAA